MHNNAQAAVYLDATPKPVIAQAYDPGPHECGVFYMRPPKAKQSFIFAMTHKTFPMLTGDGTHTVEQLIWRHPRYRMQANVFIQRHHSKRLTVLNKNETLALTIAGNHCKGTIFTDGKLLNTPELTAAINTITRTYDDFDFGHFDVR